MTATYPVRRDEAAPWHLGAATGRGYRTVCGRTIAGPDVEVPARIWWRRVWRLELVCLSCEAAHDRALARRRQAR